MQAQELRQQQSFTPVSVFRNFYYHHHEKPEYLDLFIKFNKLNQLWIKYDEKYQPQWKFYLQNGQYL